MRRERYKLIIILILVTLVLAGGLWLGSKKTSMSGAGHFEVYVEDSVFKEPISKDAERAYSNILNDLGVSDESMVAGGRIKIYVYPSQETYSEATGRPKWSIGSNVGDTINLIQGSSMNYVLPHEISHILLRRHVDSYYPPKWIDEGFAVYEEGKISDIYIRNVLSKKISLFKEGSYLSFEELSRSDISTEKDIEKVRFWYAQSYSIVKFLIEEHGSEKFSRFCITLSKRVPLDKAIQEVYLGTFSGSSDLINQWAEYIKN